MRELTLEKLHQRLYSEPSIPIKIITSRNEEIMMVAIKVNLTEKTIKGYCQGTIAKINYKNYDKLLNIESYTTSKSYELYSDKVLQTLLPFDLSLVKRSYLVPFSSTEFGKIGCDKFVNYGDGGTSWLIYPL